MLKITPSKLTAQATEEADVDLEDLDDEVVIEAQAHQHEVLGAGRFLI